MTEAQLWSLLFWNQMQTRTTLIRLASYNALYQFICVIHNHMVFRWSFFVSVEYSLTSRLAWFAHKLKQQQQNFINKQIKLRK